MKEYMNTELNEKILSENNCGILFHSQILFKKYIFTHHQLKFFQICTNPHPKFGGLPCVGSNSDTSVCNDNPCPSTLLDLLLISIQDKIYLFGFHF
jgi:hypothetical protein